MKRNLIERIVWIAVTFSIVGWSVLRLMDGRSTKAFMGLLTIVVLLAFGIWQEKSLKPFPAAFAVITYLFIFVSVGLGTFGGAYSIRHFDDFLHISSGIWIGYGAWIIMLYMLGEQVAKKLPAAFQMLYIIAMGLAVAGFWELMEFAGDKLFHFTAQGRDPDDTMFDMIDGLVGGTLAAVFIALQNKKRMKAVKE